MRTYVSIILAAFCLCACSKKSDEDTPIVNHQNPVTYEPTEVGCPGAHYNNWEGSPYVLPYPIGETYKVHLSHCSGSYHSDGRPDKFAVDFEMPIGSIITAARRGEVVHVEERGVDGEFPNNLIVIYHNDGTYAQYMHLTRFGAIPEIGDFVEKGDEIAYSGATGVAGYPHLHFVVTLDGWEYPYTSIAYNFSNTAPNPRGPKARTYYTALPY